MSYSPKQKVGFVSYNNIRGRTLIVVLVMLTCLTLFLSIRKGGMKMIYLNMETAERRLS